MESQAVNQLQFNLDHPASPTNLVTRVPANPGPVMLEKRAVDPRRMELIGRLARRDLQRSRELQDVGLPPGPKNVERRLRQGRAVVSRKAATAQQQRQQQLPSRSHSPPVRDTDGAWRPSAARGTQRPALQPRENAASMKRHEALELRRLREEVQQYAVRMAELEAERLLGRGHIGAGRRRPALPFPTRPRSPQPAMAPAQQQLRPQLHRPLPPSAAARRRPMPATAGAPSQQLAQLPFPSAASSDGERTRIVADVLAVVRRELGLRAGASAVSLATARTPPPVPLSLLSGSLADLHNIDHRLSQLEHEGDDIRDRWTAALAAGDEPIYAPDGWRPEPSDPLRFVNNARGAPPLVSAAGAGTLAGGRGSRQPVVLQLSPTEVAGIRSQRDRYREHFEAASAALTNAAVAFRPTQLTEAIAEQLLDDILADAANEMLAASDDIVSRLVANETGGVDDTASPRVPPTPRRYPPGAAAAKDAGAEVDEFDDEDYADDVDAYAGQEFESYHSSDDDQAD